MSNQFIINLILGLNCLFFTWQIYSQAKELDKIQRKIAEIEKELELLKC